jgi:hypothetical protein
LAENEPNTAEEPRNPHVRYESGDVNAVSVTKFGIAMASLILVFLFSLLGLFRYFAKRAAEAQPPAPPMGAMAQKLPPEPRLEAHPSLDMKQMRTDEDQLLNQYAWIDPDKGVVRIPVDRAMELILEKGLLPAHPEPGAPVPAIDQETPSEKTP